MHCYYCKYILLHLTLIKLSEHNDNKLDWMEGEGEKIWDFKQRFVNDNNWFRTILMEVNFQNHQIVC